MSHLKAGPNPQVVQFVGSTTEGPFTIGSDWAPHKMNRMGDGHVKVTAVANGLSFEFKKEDAAILVKSVYSLEDGGAYLLITIDFSKGSSNCKLRRFFKRDAPK